MCLLQSTDFQEIPTNKQTIGVEVKPMGTATYTMNTTEKIGPIQISLSFNAKGDGDFVCYVSQHKDNFDSLSFQKIQNRQKFNILP